MGQACSPRTAATTASPTSRWTRGTGALSLREIVPTEPVPRACQLDPAGRLLLAAGQDSGRIAAYRIEPADGRLTPMAVSEVGESPMWIMFRSDKEAHA